MFGIEHIAAAEQQKQGRFWDVAVLALHGNHGVVPCSVCLLLLRHSFCVRMTNITFNFFNMALHSLYCNGNLYLRLNRKSLY